MNRWIQHVQVYQQLHNVSWKEALIGARESYMKMGSGIKFQNGITKQQMDAFKSQGQYTSGQWQQLQNGKYVYSFPEK